MYSKNSNDLVSIAIAESTYIKPRESLAVSYRKICSTFCAETSSNKFPPNLLKLAATYEVIMERRRIMCYNLLLKIAVDIINNKEKPVSRKLFVLVDEFHDTNHLQQYLLMAYWQRFQPKMTIAGDSDQNIFGFASELSANNSSAMWDIANTLHPAVVLFLPTSYRCSTIITSVAESIICNDSGRLEKPAMRSSRRHLRGCGDVRSEVIEFVEPSAQYNSIAKWITNWRNVAVAAGGRHLKSMAILCRFNRDVADVTAALDRSKIKYRRNGSDMSLFKHQQNKWFINKCRRIYIDSETYNEGHKYLAWKTVSTGIKTEIDSDERDGELMLISFLYV